MSGPARSARTDGSTGRNQAADVATDRGQEGGTDTNRGQDVDTDTDRGRDTDVATDRGRDTDVATDRGQAAVVGVAILLAITVITLGALTASIGAVVSGHAAAADADRVAADLDRALAPEAATGARSASVRFSRGELAVVPRELRVTVDGAVVRTVAVDALRYTNGEHRVASVAGLLVRGTPGQARVTRDPLVTATDGAVVVGAARLGAEAGSVGGAGVEVRLRTNVTHSRTDLGNGTIGLAIETATPDAVAVALAAAGATVESRDRDFDGDGVPSVVVSFPGERRGYLVVHDLDLEVHHG